MATIIKKIKKGKAYWYAVESQRVNGKPRIVWQKYLGTVDSVINALGTTNGSSPKELEVHEFGAVAAMLVIANELDLVKIIDNVVPKRKQGPSIGTFVLLATINRAVAPSSKLQMSDWYEKTILKRKLRHSKDAFSSQRFWDAMDSISEENIVEIQNRLVDQILKIEKPDLNCLLYDATNFATYISSINNRNTIAKRGHSKKKRTDLRIVNLSLLTSRDGIPLFHETYAGNINDQKSFKDNILTLVELHEKLSKNMNEVVFVFDKGNRGSDPISILDHNRIPFVSSLQRSYHPDLLNTPHDLFEPIDGYSGVKSFRVKKALAHGPDRTVIVVHDEHLYAAEASSLTDDLARAIAKLGDEENFLKQHRAKRTKTTPKPKISALRKRVDETLRKHQMIFRSGVSFNSQKESLIDVEISQDDESIPILEYSINQERLQKRISTVLGKTILYTNKHDWKTSQIVAAYRGQHKIEERFRDMNDRQFLRWQPAFHWTDQKIKVHSFFCVLALLLETIARKRVSTDTYKPSTHEFLSELTDIKECLLMYPADKPPAPPKICRIYTKLSTTQKLMLSRLNLEKLQLPQRG